MNILDGTLVIYYIDEDHNQKIISSTEISDETLLYEKWWLARISLHEDVKSMDLLQKAVCIKYNHLNFFEDATINDEYMEKQEISWWSVKDLKKVLKNGGFLNNDFFRAYFIPVLQRTIQELDKYHPDRNNDQKLND